jgi:hypothetical protein
VSFLAKISDILAKICSGAPGPAGPETGLVPGGPGGAGSSNVPKPKCTTDSVVRSGGDMGARKVSENSCNFSENSNKLAKKRLRYRLFSEKSDKKSSKRKFLQS